MADFAWVGVGPLISKALADHGATVAHIESSTRPDVLRGGPPFKDGEPGLDRSQFVANFNSLEARRRAQPRHRRGLELARELIAWADVVVESFTPGTLAKFGLDYESISRDRPELGHAQHLPPRPDGTGADVRRVRAARRLPRRARPGHRLARPRPLGHLGAYTDFIAPRFGVAALTTALLHRARTGEGQHVDLAQTEAGIQFATPVVMDYLVNGRVAGPNGHASATACPHGTFRAAVPSATSRSPPRPPSSGAPSWRPRASSAGATRASMRSGSGSLTRRRSRRTSRAWCAPQDPWAIADTLAAAGVPASAVQRPSDLYRDPQLAHREFFVTLDHSVMGPTPYDGHVTKFSGTPGILAKAAPALGEDTFHVLSELVGVDEERLAVAAAAGALQ